MSEFENDSLIVSQARLVWALGVAQVLAWSTTYYLLAVLAEPIAQDTGWPVTNVVLGISCALLAASASSPYIGQLIDRHGGRPILAVGSILMASGLTVMGNSQTLGVYYVSWLIIGIGMAAGLYDAAFSTLSRLFGRCARSSMAALTLLGGFASTLGWPLIAALEQKIGWRLSCFILATIHLCVGVPIYLSMLPKEQFRAGRLILNANIRPIRNHRRSFIALALLLTFQSLITSTICVHLIHILKLQGFPMSVALAIGMVIGPAQVFARLIEFLFGKNLDPILTARLAAVVGGLGIGLLVLSEPALSAIAMVLYGFGNGILTIARGTLPLVLFGAKNYGERIGQLAIPILIAQAMGPLSATIILEVSSPTFLILLIFLLGCLSIIASFILSNTPSNEGLAMSITLEKITTTHFISETLQSLISQQLAALSLSLDDRGGMARAIMKDSEPVGILLIMEDGEIMVAIHPIHQRCGIASKALDLAAAACFEEGRFVKLKAKTTVGRPSNGLAKKMGFTEYSRCEQEIFYEMDKSEWIGRNADSTV